MSRKATIVATLASPPAAGLLEEVAHHADILEVRADLIGEVDVDWLRSLFPGELLYTLRSASEGGRFGGGRAERSARLVAAAGRYDLIDLEAERDLAAAPLSAVPPSRRVVSWHGLAGNLGSLRSRLERMRSTEARLWKLVPEARSYAEAKLPLALLEGVSTTDVVAFASGRLGSWTRLVAPRVGAPVVFAAVGDRPGAPGQLSLERLGKDYGLPDLWSARQIFGVVGNPVEHSLSPRFHNGLYRTLDVDALYLAFQVEEFGAFWLEMVESELLGRLGMPLSGLSVTTPHKELALAVAGASSPLAKRIGAANTLVSHRGVWEAEATDPEGVVGPLEARAVALAGRRGVVVGVGGAGRAAAVGLEQAGAAVELANRSVDRGRTAAARLRMPFVGMLGLEPSRYDLLVNATPLGRRSSDDSPFDVAAVSEGATVIDMVYAEASETALIAAARARDLEVVTGREVLLYQARTQFRMMTGLDVPLDAAKRLLDIEPSH